MLQSAVDAMVLSFLIVNIAERFLAVFDMGQCIFTLPREFWTCTGRRRYGFIQQLYCNKICSLIEFLKFLLILIIFLNEWDILSIKTDFVKKKKQNLKCRGKVININTYILLRVRIKTLTTTTTLEISSSARLIHVKLEKYKRGKSCKRGVFKRHNSATVCRPATFKFWLIYYTLTYSRLLWIITLFIWCIKQLSLYLVDT